MIISVIFVLYLFPWLHGFDEVSLIAFLRPANFLSILAAIQRSQIIIDLLGTCFTWSIFPSLAASFDKPTATNWAFFIHSLNMPEPFKSYLAQKHALYWQHRT